MMDTDLFHQEPYGGEPPHNGTETSMAAAKAIRDKAPTQRERVRVYIERCGMTGATRDEIARDLNLGIQSVCARVGELINAESPQVQETKVRRETRSGGSGFVLVGVCQ